MKLLSTIMFAFGPVALLIAMTVEGEYDLQAFIVGAIIFALMWIGAMYIREQNDNKDN